MFQLKKTFFIVFLTLYSFLSVECSYAQEKNYRVGIVPQFAPRELSNIWLPLLQEISKRTGYTFEMYGAASIPKFEENFQNGIYDFAYMNPYHALVAYRTQGYTPILKDSARKLNGVLVVRKDSPYQSPTDLRGKKIAFPAPNALGASLLMRADLLNKFQLYYEPIYVQNHSSSYLNVILGEAQAAGGVMSSLNKQKPQIRDNLRIIYQTQSISPHPIVFHPRVPIHVVNAFKATAFELFNEEKWQDQFKKIPIEQLSTANIDDYTILNTWNLDRFYIKPEQ